MFQTSKLKFQLQGFDDIGGLQLGKPNFQDRMECTISSSKATLGGSVLNSSRSEVIVLSNIGLTKEVCTFKDFSGQHFHKRIT